MVIKMLFWILIGLIAYSYFGYTIILAIIAFLKNRLLPECSVNEKREYPEITIVIAAYNEEFNIANKVLNTQQQNYPKDKITQLWINDASTDNTKSLLAEYSFITVLNQPERMGKIAAINTALPFVKTPITIFSDANAMLSADAIGKLVEPFQKQNVGCVAGEKRIYINTADNAAAMGEGAYWKYESFIKKLESDCSSTLSATGELYAIRTELFDKVESDTILDDFVISTNILKKGLSIKYVPNAFASETASANIKEEQKRKIRIAAGSFQSLFRNLDLINPFKHPFLTFQFFSHKILRWFVLPLSLVLTPLLNVLILINDSENTIYVVTLLIQMTILSLIIVGWILKDKKVSTKWISLPYYLFIMNISIIQGFLRFLKGSQNVKWDKSLRQT